MSFILIDNTPSMAASIYSSLLSKGTMSIDAYNVGSTTLMKVNEFHVKEQELEGASVEIDIEYTRVDTMGLTTGEGSLTPRIDGTLPLVFLSPFGDKEWDEAFKNRLFKGNPPIAIALDKKNGMVFLVFYTNDSLRLSLFCEVQEDELEKILDSISYKTPYKLILDNKVLMRMVTGEEGYNYARQLLKVQFNTVVGHIYTSLSVQGVDY